MSNQMAQLQEATIQAQCKTLRMPMIASQFGTLAAPAFALDGRHRAWQKRAKSMREGCSPLHGKNSRSGGPPSRIQFNCA
jgi:hypothetical protein